MSSLLPVLHEHNPAMSLCQMCPKPGMCCKNFPLSQGGFEVTFWEGSWKKDVETFLKEKKLPFIPVKIHAYYQTKEFFKYVTVVYSCPKVTPEGRCSIYKDRPDLCKRYLPGESDICCFYKGD